MSFVKLPVSTDYDELVADAYARLAILFPGWVPNEASLEAAILAERARFDRETAVVASDVGESALAGLAALYGVNAIAGARAGLEITITAGDDAGYTLLAGFQFAYRLTGDTLIGFRTTEDAVIDPGDTSAAGIAAEAALMGLAGNGVPSGSSFEPVDSYAWIASIVSTADSAGGAEAETGTQLLNRIADRLTLLADRPILPDDFATLAENVAGVYRARALDGWNPDDSTTNNERMVSVAAIDVDGSAVASGTKDLIDDLLEDRREIGFAVRVIDPTYTDIAVVFAATALPGYVAATVEAEAEQAVTDYLNPATWGGGDQEPPTWTDDDAVRYLEVASVLNAVEGLDVVTSLTLNGTEDDVDLTGPLPLPSRVEVGGSTVAGTVS